VLTVVFSFPLISGAIFADQQSSLPACCRRDGKHHCAMMDTSSEQNEAPGAGLKGISNKCPNYPKTAAVRTFSKVLLLSASERFFAHIASHPTVQPQVEARQRISFSRSRQKRGPPILLS
jgi:hypothetical protein